MERLPSKERSDASRDEGATTVVISAAPGALLEPLIAELAAIGEVERWAPMSAPAWLSRAPGAVGRYAQRRAVGGASVAGAGAPGIAGVRTAPAMLGIDAALRAFAGARTDRRYQAEFALRAAIDVWAAREVRARKPATVIAPTLAARRTFAAARAVGARTVLVLDLPLLRTLHRDLDRAAEHWPERAFLRRFRAPSWAIARQEAERVLADQIVVRGSYAHATCVADGIPESRISRLPAPPPRALPAPAVPTGRVRLAGLAAARHGIDTALAATRELGLTLVVRPGEGTEPADLTRRPGVATDDDPVDAIICPAVCETYAPELRVSGTPVLASPAAGGSGPEGFDVAGWIAALSRFVGDDHRAVSRSP